jgi:hypothetical protein
MIADLPPRGQPERPSLLAWTVVDAVTDPDARAHLLAR